MGKHQHKSCEDSNKYFDFIVMIKIGKSDLLHWNQNVS